MIFNSLSWWIFLSEIPKSLIGNSSNFLSGNIIKNKIEKKYDVLNNNNIEISSIVELNVFGKGKVLNIEGVGNNSKLTILFINNVTKKLILKYANLKKIK